MANINPAMLKLQRSMQQTAEKTNTQATVNIPIDKLDANPDNESIFGMPDIEQFSEILKKDFRGAVVVFEKITPNGEKRYEIGSGHRRVEALRVAGKTEVPAIVCPMPDDVDKAEFLIDSNMLNRPMTPINKAKAFQYVKDKYIASGMGIIEAEDKIAERYNMSRMNVRRHLTLLNLIPELQELVTNRCIAWTSAIDIASKDVDIQTKVYEAISPCIDDDGNLQMTASNIKYTIEAIEKHPTQDAVSRVQQHVAEIKEKEHKSKIKVTNTLVRLSNMLETISTSDSSKLEMPTRNIDTAKEAISKIRECLDKIESMI